MTYYERVIIDHHAQRIAEQKAYVEWVLERQRLLSQTSQVCACCGEDLPIVMFTQSVGKKGLPVRSKTCNSCKKIIRQVKRNLRHASS